MIAFWIGVYLALGLPIAVGLALTESGAPWIRRVAWALTVLPIWPAWSVEMVWVHHRQVKLLTVCYWCGDRIGYDPGEWSRHLMTCPKHPLRLWLQAQGWGIVENEDGEWVLGEYLDPKDKRWEVTEHEDFITVVPLNDLRPHDEGSEYCECNPTVDDEGDKKIITHQAYDFREVSEYLNEKGDGEE